MQGQANIIIQRAGRMPQEYVHRGYRHYNMLELPENIVGHYDTAHWISQEIS